MVKLLRKPTTPGEILRDEFLIPLGLTQKQLADHIGIDLKVINRIVKERSGVSAVVAVKLAHALRTTPEFWLTAQMTVDIFRAQGALALVPSPLVSRRSQ